MESVIDETSFHQFPTLLNVLFWLLTIRTAFGIAHGSLTPVQLRQLYPLPAAGLRSDCGYRGVPLFQLILLTCQVKSSHG